MHDCISFYTAEANKQYTKVSDDKHCVSNTINSNWISKCNGKCACVISTGAFQYVKLHSITHITTVYLDLLKLAVVSEEQWLCMRKSDWKASNIYIYALCFIKTSPFNFFNNFATHQQIFIRFDRQYSDEAGYKCFFCFVRLTLKL